MGTYGGMIGKYARRYFKNDEDIYDVIGDVYLKLLTGAAEKYTGETTPLTYIATITKNHCIDIRRRRRHSFKHDQLDHDIPTETMPEIGVSMLLDLVEERHRDLVRMHFVEGYTFDEISDITGMTFSSVSSRVSRAIRRARAVHGGGI
jgi:RNA polymerase sigma-70 factor (ECF subfamily)